MARRSGMVVVAAWGTTYAYDGWGNLTDKSLTKGSAPVMHTVYDPTLNMVAGSAAPNVVPQGYFSDYDVEDRPLNGNAGIWTGMSGRMTYDHAGKKVFWKAEVNPAPGGIQAYCELYFYGIAGQKLARYKCTYDASDSENPNMFSLLLQDRTQHVGGGLTSSDGTGVTTDRLGSIRAKDNGEQYTYYPYGEAKTESVSGGGMYAGLESPVRNYVATMGRFDRPDPLGMRGVVMGNPGSWNRFAYTTGDPVNFVDPIGTNAFAPTTGYPCGPNWATDASLAGPCAGPGYGGVYGDGGGGGGSSCAFNGVNYFTGAPDPACYAPPTPPVSPPPNLECNFNGGQYFGPTNQVTPTSGPLTGQLVTGVFQQMIFSFSATGGDGTYTWSNTQTIYIAGTAGLSNGSTVALNQSMTETLANLGRGGAARINDNPGLRYGNGTASIVAAAAVWNATLQVSVTSGNQTIRCPTVTWQAWEVWQTVNGTLETSGSAYVTGVRP